MNNSSLNKIVLKNTTKISLNERFTAYRQQAQNSANAVRQKIQMQHQASAENRRLAQQMAHRPSVLAALKIKKRSVQQRLGQKRNALAMNSSNIKARLGDVRRIRGRNFQRGANRGFIRSGTSPLLKARLGSTYGFRSPFARTSGTAGAFRGGRRRNFNRGGMQQARNNRNQGQGRRGRGRGGGNRIQNTRGRSGWNNNLRKALPTKQELDNQLDEYMAETKSLDLSQFMS